MDPEVEAKLIALSSLASVLVATHPHPDMLKTLLSNISAEIQMPPSDMPDRAAVVQRVQDILKDWVSTLDLVLQSARPAG